MRIELLGKIVRKSGRTPWTPNLFNTIVETNKSQESAYEYGTWEYHPVYGTYSRIVYKRSPYTKAVIMVGREYKPVAV